MRTPFEVFDGAGVTIDFVSPKGGAIPEDAYNEKDASDRAFKASKAYRRMNHSRKLAEVDASDYDAIFFPAGLGPMGDIATDADLKLAVARAWNAGGIVAAVCHGPVALHGVTLDDGTPLVRGRQLDVIAIQNPLSSLADDVAATRRGIDVVAGPVVLVGHSWGGTVITQAGTHDKVKALVYVAAYAPNEGQSSVDTTKGYPTPPGHAEFRPYGDGYIAMTAAGIAQHFVPDSTPAERRLAFVTQGPVQGKAFQERVSAAAWKTKPSYYIVATKDHMIDPGQERAMAKQINATTTELSTGHVPMLSNPRAVAEVITAAARKVSSRK